MKPITLLLLFFTAVVSAQVVNIPDANFKNRLVSTNCVDIDADFVTDQDVDTNNDGEIQITEALAVNNLYVDYAEISDLTGIEFFTNLTRLRCSFNQITSIDVSNLTNLTSLDCGANQLTSLDVSNLTNLTSLSVFGNQLSNLNLGIISNITLLQCGGNQNLQPLDVSNLTNLQFYECNDNSLTSLDLSNNNNLLSLNCANNQLTQLDISNLTQLQYLNYSNNILPNLDFSNSPLLSTIILDGTGRTTLEVSWLNSLFQVHCSNNNIMSLNITNQSIQALNCYGNLFSTLDVSACPNLTTLRCGSNFLRNLFMKNGRNENFDLDISPNLELICADESQFDIVSFQIDNSGSSNAILTSYCSFTPGGNYNTIRGNLRYDLNNNGCDASDYTNQYIKVNINDGVQTGSTFTNNLGDYTFYTQAGNFSLTPEVENPSYFNFSPPSATLNFPLVDNSIQTQNFCITANGVHPDLEVTFLPIGNARPGFDALYKVVYKNKGNQTLSGNITLAYNSNLLDFISTFPNDNFELNLNQILWNYSNLLPLETRTIDLVLRVIAPPIVNSGDILNFTATINPIVTDETPLDNTFGYDQLVINSYDPNQIECLEGNTITPTEVGKYLHYNIDFENVGTADAVNVVVKSTINPAKFNVNSLQLQYASHEVETKVTGNIVEFIFRNIHLQPSTGGPIGGHGNVLFKIKTIPDLVIGDEVMGSASIFFDYNAPIDTNEARTVIASLKNPGFIQDPTIEIAPNPVKDKLTITAKGIIKSVQLFDAQGRILQTVLEHKKATTLDISNQASGVYFVKVMTETGGEVQKIVKEN